MHCKPGAHWVTDLDSGHLVGIRKTTLVTMAVAR